VGFPAAYAPVRRELTRVAGLIGSHVREADPAVASVMSHVAASRGGMIRPALLLLSGRSLGRLTPAHLKLALAVEMMHTATLLHDDVIDQAAVRRGRASLNHLWGNDCAVVAGDYLLARTLRISGELQDVRMSGILADTAQTMCRGELRQDLLRDKWSIREDDYNSIIEDKTAAFFSACCRLGAVASGASARRMRALAAFGLHLGMAFQHTDDLLDIIGTQRETRKTNGSDLANGKLTLAFIYMLARLSVSRRRAAIRQIQSNHSSVPELLAQLRQTGALRHVHGTAQRHTDRAIASLRVLDDCEASVSLARIAGLVTSRIDPALL
jgi:octaprenyl-diphosphate synthase